MCQNKKTAVTINCDQRCIKTWRTEFTRAIQVFDFIFEDDRSLSNINNIDNFLKKFPCPIVSCLRKRIQFTSENLRGENADSVGADKKALVDLLIRELSVFVSNVGTKKCDCTKLLSKMWKASLRQAVLLLTMLDDRAESSTKQSILSGIVNMLEVYTNIPITSSCKHMRTVFLMSSRERSFLDTYENLLIEALIGYFKKELNQTAKHVNLINFRFCNIFVIKQST